MWWYVAITGIVLVVWLLVGLFTMCIEFGCSLRNPISMLSRERLPPYYHVAILLIGPLVLPAEIANQRRRKLPLGFAWPTQSWCMEAHQRQAKIEELER